MNEPDDGVEVSLAERQTAVARLPQDLQVLLETVRERQVLHVHPRNHDVAGFEIDEPEYVLGDLVLQRRDLSRSG